MRFSALIFSAIVLSSLLAAPAQAQDADVAAAGQPERIIRPMQPLDPVTLRAEGVSIRLWGIKPARSSETPLELKALDVLDTLTSAQMVNCKIVGGAVPELTGQCQNQSNEDLALSLLEKGYVVVDRRQTYNTVLATGYAQAQETARLKKLGVWRFVNDAEAPEQTALPKWLGPHMGVLLPLALMFGPLAGLLVLGIVMHAGLSRISARQSDTQEEALRKEEALQARERQILVSTLESELSDNKNKAAAFLSIYGDMLAGLKDPHVPPKYQQAGDIVQKHPAFSKTVFEASVGKLALLDVKTAGMISKLYTALPKEQEYINLDPDVPLDTAVRLLEKVLNDAQNLLPNIEKAIAALQAAEEKPV